MTREEIVRALEHCAGDYNSCASCPLYDPQDDDCACSRRLKLEAAALLKKDDKAIGN